MIKIINEKEGNYIMIKYSILQENITTLNIYAPNERTSKYIKQMLMEWKEGRDKSTIIVGNIKKLHPQLTQHCGFSS